jgi:hypothetical protein
MHDLQRLIPAALQLAATRRLAGSTASLPASMRRREVRLLQRQLELPLRS